MAVSGSDGSRAGSWRVVSDVDHTLLEEGSEIPLAGHCLARLHRQGIPTLLASSKTFAEMVELHSRAALPPQPFLFENGCGIGWPRQCWPEGAGSPARLLGEYGAIVRGGDPGRLRSLLLHLRRDTGLRFSLLEEVSTAEISRLIGLTEPQARLAQQRLASLPLVWRDSDGALEVLRQRLAADALRAVSGGRLIHVAPPFDKGEALALALAWLPGGASQPRLLACGDSENDRSLLESADVAVVFHPPHRPPLALAAPTAGRRRLQRTAIAAGPSAWLAAVEEALSEAPTAPMAP